MIRKQFEHKPTPFDYVTRHKPRRLSVCYDAAKERVGVNRHLGEFSGENDAGQQFICPLTAWYDYRPSLASIRRLCRVANSGRYPVRVTIDGWYLGIPQPHQ